jgi:hypothetical protein
MHAAWTSELPYFIYIYTAVCDIDAVKTACFGDNNSLTLACCVPNMISIARALKV